MRVRKKPWALKELETNGLVVKDPFAFKGKWKETFSENNPIHVELGCGKGKFISKSAAENHDINFIGIERQGSVAGTAARRLSPESKNIFLICGYVEKLEDMFEKGEIERIYINFCDPWPKTRYAKRRLTHTNYLNMYKRLFKGKGEIFFKTDNQGLFEFSLEEFSKNGFIISNVSLNLHESNIQNNIMTEYEEKFSGKGMPIYRCKAYFCENSL
ncbi:MAG: tRNA (guanosine(46)-N7)-methyltransferase TrmB [Lachnospiraceae bacterium]|nr:tRNA (guanosine(46)-N7)-methyltransferase TrmB [Lachnospiraceae bacterium]